AGQTSTDATEYRRDVDMYRKRVTADRTSRPENSRPQTQRSTATRRGQSARATEDHPQRTQRSRSQNPQRPSRTRDTSERSDNRKRQQQKPAFLIGFPWKPALIAAVALFVLVGGGIAFAATRPVAVILNGTELEVGGSKTVGAVIDEGYIAPTPGDFVAVDGEVLESGKGKTFSAWINGAYVDDPATPLKGGDIITMTDGGNIVEESDDTVITVPYEVIEEGNGPIHVVEGEGSDGHSITKVGKVSGKTFVDEAEAANLVCRKYYPDTGDDKVIALTFDDGPWPGSTEQILNVLKEYDVKATFFTVGERFDENGKALVKRAYDAGHQICTHSFDHARGDGKSVDLGLMSPEKQVEEITKGFDVIKEATGAEASKVIRTPGGNFKPPLQKNIAPYITAEIGWTIDSGDWRKPGAGAIADEIMAAWSGAIVLCHDGGGDRTQTVEALKTAIPYLLDQGYTFVTIDELMSYPYKEL
ncbi:MAG: polysaccharide deacetylase family protein, partial [Raoultibacter sp.]